MYLYVYKNYEAGRSLVTYDQFHTLKMQELTEQWQQSFLNQSYPTELISSTGLIPYKFLEKTGHVSAFSDNPNQIFMVSGGLALRPETCCSIFAYELERYGNAIKQIALYKRVVVS